jgi:ATP-dependent DNA helicase RecG
VSVENLKDLNESIPRNPRIANVLYYHRLFESWGRGVQMIISECTKAGHPEPFYSQEAGGTKLTLPSSGHIGSTSPIISEPLSARQEEIMRLLKTHNGLSPDELRQLMVTPITERTLRNELNRLKEQGLIDVLGQTRTRKWYAKT